MGTTAASWKRDPDFTDAYQVPGVYDYGIATLPRALRMLAFLFGVRGDKERGLDWLARTAQEGERSRWGALWAQVLFMQREDRLEEALVAIRTLREQFPKNPDYALEELGVHLHHGETAEARDEVLAFIEQRDAGFGNYHLTPGGLPELRLGRVLAVRREVGRSGGGLLTGSRVLSAFRHLRDAALPPRQCPRRHGSAAEGAFRLQPGTANRRGQSGRRLGKGPAQEALARERPGGVPATPGGVPATLAVNRRPEGGDSRVLARTGRARQGVGPIRRRCR